MENRIRIEIIDKGSGLRSDKELNLQKRFHYIGSDAKSDIVLGANEEKGVTPKHLQVILDAGGAQVRCRAVNLSGSPIQVADSQQEILEKLTAMDICGEETLTVGAYELVFHMGDSPDKPAFTRPVPAPVQTMPGEPTIRLRIELPHMPLTPETPLNGRVYITNLSNRRDVQVALKGEGLPPEKFRIGQAPLLYPGAEQSVYIQLEHPASPAVQPGIQKITISAEFGDADAKEAVSASQDIQVAPFYKHSVRLIRAK